MCAHNLWLMHQLTVVEGAEVGGQSDGEGERKRGKKRGKEVRDRKPRRRWDGELQRNGK